MAACVGCAETVECKPKKKPILDHWLCVYIPLGGRNWAAAPCRARGVAARGVARVTIGTCKTKLFHNGSLFFSYVTMAGGAGTKESQTGERVYFRFFLRDNGRWSRHWRASSWQRCTMRRTSRAQWRRLPSTSASTLLHPDPATSSPFWSLNPKP